MQVIGLPSQDLRCCDAKSTSSWPSPIHNLAWLILRFRNSGSRRHERDLFKFHGLFRTRVSRVGPHFLRLGDRWIVDARTSCVSSLSTPGLANVVGPVGANGSVDTSLRLVHRNRASGLRMGLNSLFPLGASDPDGKAVD